MRAPARRIAGVAAALVVTLAGAEGCRKPAPQPEVVPPPPLLDTTPVSPWPGVLDSARRALHVGRFNDAERILAAFSVEHIGSPEAAESEFWRAVVLADPDNPGATPRSSIAALDAYLARGADSPYYPAVRTLRRLTELTDSLRTAVATARTNAEAREKAHEEEVQHLRDSLTATQAELERIRRRITGGRKP